jgi:hypothetical protein
MRTSTGWLKHWTVSNDPAEDGGDKRVVEVRFAVQANSAIALAVAALFERTALLGVALKDGGGRDHTLSDVPCTIAPPWGAKKKGDFCFVARMPYSDALVRDLTTITHGVPLVIALENAQHEINLDAEQEAVFGFVAGG